METSALMGMNVAQLIVNDHLEILESQFSRPEDILQKVLSDTQDDVEFREL